MLSRSSSNTTNCVNTNHSTQVNKTAHARQTLCRRIQAANHLHEEEARIKEYDSLLNTSELERFLTKEEIGNIFWNKALDHSKVADAYFNGDMNGRQQLVPALRHQHLAIADMNAAHSFYENAVDLEAASNETQGMTRVLDLIMAKLEENTAPIPE